MTLALAVALLLAGAPTDPGGAPEPAAVVDAEDQDRTKQMLSSGAGGFLGAGVGLVVGGGLSSLAGTVIFSGLANGGGPPELGVLICLPCLLRPSSAPWPAAR